MTLIIDPEDRRDPQKVVKSRSKKVWYLALATFAVYGTAIGVPMYLMVKLFTPAAQTEAEKAAALEANTRRNLRNEMIRMCQEQIKKSAIIPASVRFTDNPNVGLNSHVTGTLTLENRLGLRLTRTYGCWWSNRSMDVYGVFEGEPRRPYGK